MTGEASEPFNKSWTAVVYVWIRERLMSSPLSINPSLCDSQGTSPAPQRLGKKEPQLTVPEVRALLSHLLEVRVWDIDEILAWSNWRRERNRRAAASHRKRRLAEQWPPRGKKKKPAL